MKMVMVLMLGFMLSGCASLLDAPKNVVGFSTRDLESARSRSVYQSYDCDLSECFSAVLTIAAEKKIPVFMQDDAKGLLVFMGLPGHVDTTEVGVFLSNAGSAGGTKVEVASRSSSAKRLMAQMLLSELARMFSKI